MGLMALGFFIQDSARAETAIFLEPGLSYASGTFTQERSGATLGTAEEAIDSSGVGFKLLSGVRWSDLFTGIEFQGGKFDYQPDLDRTGESSWMFLGLPFGYWNPEFPIAISASYGFMSRYRLRAIPGTTRLYKGSALKLGIALRFRPFSYSMPKIGIHIERIFMFLGSARGLDGTSQERDHPATIGNPPITYNTPQFSIWQISLTIPFDVYVDEDTGPGSTSDSG